MKVGEPNTLASQGIEIWSLNHFIAMKADIAVTLVVCHDKDYIRSLNSNELGCQHAKP